MTSATKRRPTKPPRNGSTTNIAGFRRWLQVCDEAAKVLGRVEAGESALLEIAELLVPTVADCVTVDLATRHGVSSKAAAVPPLRRIAVVVADPMREPFADEALRRHAPRDGHPIFDVLRTGTPLLVERTTDALVGSMTDDPVERRFLLAHGPQSFISVPLAARGRAYGVITLGSTRPGHFYDERDLDFAVEFVSRVALPIDTALRYDQRKRG